MDRAAPVETELPPFPRMQGVGDDGFISIDIPCRTCGYDLHALSAEAKCPECGTDVLLSLRGEQLCDADPRWVNRLASGALWIAWTLVAQFLTNCIVQGFSIGGSLVSKSIIAIFLVPWLIGVWCLT